MGQKKNYEYDDEICKCPEKEFIENNANENQTSYDVLYR